VTPAGTVTRAWSLTVAVSVVVWLVSGSVTVVWALTMVAPNASIATPVAAIRTGRTARDKNGRSIGLLANEKKR
jgi:hypothetical protein